MSESENCVEQREEPAELEEAGGAEVTRFKLFPSLTKCFSNTPPLSLMLPLFALKVIPSSLC